ncbi:hypothetical protein [Absidia glauca]|uniref:Uncharacterized protein n=1 Tax=Absidia glauca TaxID=4829 RepID=A0A170AP38_ABSGL|nr:hypothetical protein [Absidia glauca]
MDDDNNPNSDLIQQATTRLRRKQMEEQLSSMMDYMASVQIQSTYIYEQLASAMKMTQQLKDYDDVEQQHQQMDLLEHQFKLHQTMLHQWFPLSTHSLIHDDHDDTGSYSETIDAHPSPSLLSDLDKDMAALGQQWKQLHRYQRRLRVKHHRQKHQRRQRMHDMDDDENVLADLAIANSSSSATTASSASQHHHYHQHHRKNLHSAMGMHHLPLSNQAVISPPLSQISCRGPSSSSSHLAAAAAATTATKSVLPLPPLSLSPSCSCQFSYSRRPDDASHHHNHLYYNTQKDDMPGHPSLYGYYDDDDDNSSYDTNRSEYSSIDAQSLPSSDTTPPKESLDTAFDDTMAFLEQMAGKGGDNDDGGLDGAFDDDFFQDMAFLLDHPELCDQSLADLTPLLEQQHQVDNDAWEVSEPPHEASSPYIYNLCTSGVQWCRFLSVLTASTMISLLNGPDDLLMD